MAPPLQAEENWHQIKDYGLLSGKMVLVLTTQFLFRCLVIFPQNLHCEVKFVFTLGLDTFMVNDIDLDVARELSQFYFI